MKFISDDQRKRASIWYTNCLFLSSFTPSSSSLSSHFDQPHYSLLDLFSLSSIERVMSECCTLVAVVVWGKPTSRPLSGQKVITSRTPYDRLVMLHTHSLTATPTVTLPLPHSVTHSNNLQLLLHTQTHSLTPTHSETRALTVTHVSTQLLLAPSTSHTKHGNEARRPLPASLMDNKRL